MAVHGHTNPRVGNCWEVRVANQEADHGADACAR